MSRGLTEEPTPQSTGPSQEDFDDLAGFVGMLSMRIDALEDLLARAIKLNLEDSPEAEALDKKRVKGL